MTEFRKTPMIFPEKEVYGEGRLCTCCGRKMPASSDQNMWVVHMIDGGANVLHPDDYEAYMKQEPEELSGEMGLHPVGPTCAKKKFSGFAALVDTQTYTRIK